MTLDQHINTTLVVNNSGITQEAFGTQAHLCYDPPWTDVSRVYRRRTEAISDGFSADSPEVKFLTSVFSQSPRPPLAKLIRGTRPPTQRYTLDATALSSKVYALSVGGEGVTATDVARTSDTTPTKAKIHSLLLTDLNAVVGRNYLTTFQAVAFADFTFTVPDHTNDKLHAVGHGRQTGDGPLQLTNAGGALPAGSAPATNYWLIRDSADDLKLAISLANALAGTPVVDLTGAGTGVHTVQHLAGTLSPTLPIQATATAAGNWFTLAVVNTAVLSITQDHADPGIASDLDDIQAQDSDWYYLSTTFNSETLVKGAAAWIEGTPFKAYVPEVVDSASENVAVGGGDVGDDVKAFAYKRTGMAYHRKPGEFWSAGWIGQLSAFPVGKWTAAYKGVVGSTADKFSSNQTNNLDAKRMSYYKTEADTPITWEGKVGSLSYLFLDVTVSLDFVLDLIRKRAFSLLRSLPKLAYEDEDIAMMAGAIRGALDECSSESHKIISKGTPGDPNNPQPSVKFPRVTDVDPGVRSLRNLPDGDVFFRLQSAIHTVDVGVTVIF